MVGTVHLIQYILVPAVNEPMLFMHTKMFILPIYPLGITRTTSRLVLICMHLANPFYLHETNSNILGNGMKRDICKAIESQ